ncbi:MAG TPA: Uma2 family endonuclease [Planctomycetaceae bacterium]|nr:Uma2 family endonuclease [Planctomycetaceae bacterium]
MTTVTDVDVEALFDQLSRIEGKGEIVDGKVVEMTGTGPWPGDVATLILLALFQYSKRTKQGHAVGDRNTFRVNLPHRFSFSPDVAYHTGSRIPMKYYEGAPAFAVEVRSENDYGRWSEREMAQKRADYFAAGTLVVWDIDLLSNDVVRVYRATSPEEPTIYRPGDTAEAEPAVPGWTMPVNDLLPEDWTQPRQ